MKEKNILNIKQLVTATYVINGVSVLIVFGLCYVHYFKNAGLGDYLYAFSLFSLNSFFLAKAATNYEKVKYAKRWLIFAIVATLMTGFYIQYELVGSLIYYLVGLQLILLCICIINVSNYTVFNLASSILFFISIVSAALSIIAVSTWLLSVIWLALFPVN